MTAPVDAKRASFEDRLLYVIFCDQARTEDTRKGLYIGVYGSTMIIEGDFPAFLASLSIAICIKPAAPREKMRVDVTMPGEEKSLSFEKEHQATHPDDSIVWMMNIAPFVCGRPGFVRVQVTFADGNKVEKSLRVMSRAEYQDATLLWPKSLAS